MTKNKNKMNRVCLCTVIAISFAVALTIIFTGCVGEKENTLKTAQGDDVQKNPWEAEGYPYELGTFEGLDAETEWQILQDWFNEYEKSLTDSYSLTIADLYIDRYYGTYNSFVVVIIGIREHYGTIPTVMIPPYIIPPYIVDDIKFTVIFTVWNNRHFYDLRELYISGLINYNDIENIARLFYPVNWDESIWRIK